MKILFVGLFMSLLFPLGKPEDCDKIEDISRYEYSWALKIQSIVTLRVVSLGTFFTPNNVVSAFSPFLEVARKEKLVSNYQIITYRRLSDIFCYRKRNPVEFIPPSEWPHTNLTNVPDVAIWRLEELELGEPVQFHPTTPGETVEVMKSVTSLLHPGMSCLIFNFRYSEATHGETYGLLYTLQYASACEPAYCSENICNVTKQFRYCAVILQERHEPWKKGTSFFCNHTLAGVLGRFGMGPQTSRLFLLGGVQDALEVYRKWQIKSSQTTPTRGDRPSWTGMDGKESTESSDWTVDGNDSDGKDTAKTLLTSRLNAPLVFSTLTKATAFKTEVPQRAKLSGNALSVHPALYVIWVIVFYERFT